MLGLLDTVDDILVKPFMPDRAVVALDVGVLLRLARLDVLLRKLYVRISLVLGRITPYETCIQRGWDCYLLGKAAH